MRKVFLLRSSVLLSVLTKMGGAVLCFLVCGLSLEAAPPSDLSHLKGGTTNRKVVQKPLSDDEITFTGDDDAAAAARNAIPSTANARMLYSIYGKTLPGRGGKNIVTLRKGHAVNVLKESADKRWWAIQTMGSRPVKAWVPKAAVQQIGVKESPKAAPTPDLEL